MTDVSGVVLAAVVELWTEGILDSIVVEVTK